MAALIMVAWLVLACALALGIGALPRDGREDYREADDDH